MMDDGTGVDFACLLFVWMYGMASAVAEKGVFWGLGLGDMN